MFADAMLLEHREATSCELDCLMLLRDAEAMP
jgi:hypothetical protein